MAYTQFGKIEAADIDTGLIGPMDATARLNALWGTGFGSRGYGQSPILPDVNIGDPVLASDWSNMNTLANKISGHTGIAISQDTFTRGGRIQYNSGLTKSMISSLDDSRTSSRFQAPSANLMSIANDYGWFNKLTYTVTATFPDGDSARYYFNCGGQFAIRTWQPGINSTPIRASIARLANEIGTIYWSIVPGGSSKTRIQNVDYAATTKIGGSGTPALISGSQDYYTASTYSTTNTPTTIFRQNVSGGVPGYEGSFISVGVYTKGDKGINGANGNIVVMTLTVDIAPNSVAMPSGGIVYFYTVGPYASASTTYLPYQSWATPTVDIIVTAA